MYDLSVRLIRTAKNSKAMVDTTQSSAACHSRYSLSSLSSDLEPLKEVARHMLRELLVQ